ncbi:MAG: sulfatase-like hydrolase/transferase [Verrucomicrobiales bacterium]|nr:sulfatase-like hydrolase/transferase [Verrucomicrobiales bacterium]
MNVLLFIMDACQAQALESSSACITPHFNRLAEQGIRFNRAYCPSPTCSPSRASLMTGLLPHNHGVLEVEHGRDDDQCVLRADKPHWAQHLSAAGYSTGYFGKWHIERSHQVENFGWQHHYIKGASHHAGLGAGIEPGAQNVELDPELTRYHRGPEGYRDILHYGVTDVSPEIRYPKFTVDKTIEFIGKQSEAPWCAVASFSEPNEALVVSRETFQRYDVETIPLPDNLRDDYENRPNLYQRQKQIAADVTDEEWRMARACYYGRITELDDQFGRLYDTLRDSGQLDDTLIIVTADHGRYVGAHGFDAHNFGPFEEIYRIPMIVSGPGVSAGRVSESLVGFHDIGPTILEHCGTKGIDVPDSESFAPVLKDPDKESRAFLYAESHGTRFSLTQRILWEGDWKYVFNGFDFDELYHLGDDPLEMANLIDLPEHGDQASAMMAKIWKVIQETGDRTLNETHYFSMRMGRVGPGASEG